MLKTFSNKLTRHPIWLAMLIFVIALLPRVTTLGNTFVVNDESLYWKWSSQFANALLAGNWRETMIGVGYPSITVVWVNSLGAGLQYLLWQFIDPTAAEAWRAVVLQEPLVFDLLGQRRIIMGVANAFLIMLIFLQARKLTGSGIAFLGAAFMALSPFLVADARTMRGDAMMSSLMLLSALLLLNYLRRPRWFRLILAGVAFGLALLTKMTAIPLAGFMGLAVLAHMLRHPEQPWSGRLRRGGITLAVGGLVTAATFFALWPALWVAPREVADFMRSYAASSIDGRLNYFWGNLTTDEQIWLFYPNAFLFRANPVVVLGVAVAAGLALVSGWRWLQQQGVNLNRLWQMPSAARLTVLALGVYTLIYGLVLTYGALKRDRYLMPIFPAIMFIAAAGLLWLVKWAARRWPGQRLPGWLAGGRWAWAALLLLLMLEVGHVLTTHPFYYTYWSPLLGGGRVAMHVMMAEGGIDSAALVKLNRLPNAQNQTVALLTSRDFEPAYVGKIVRLTNGSPWVTAHHVLVRQYHYQTQKMDPNLVAYLQRNPPEFIDEYQGFTWDWVYPGPAAQHYAGSMLDGQAELLGYNLSASAAAEDRPLRLKLFWQNHGLQSPAAIYVRLVDAGGFTWAETSALPLPGFAAAAQQPRAIVESEALLSIPPGTPPGLYFIKMGIAAGSPGQPDIGQFELPHTGDALAVQPPGQPQPPPIDNPLNRPFGPELTLLGVETLPVSPLTPQTPQPLTLFWQANAAVSADYAVIIRLLDAAGGEAARWSGPPARGVLPAGAWPPQAIIRDPWRLDLAQADAVAATLAPGRHTLAVSLRNAQTGHETEPVAVGAIDVSDRLRLFEPPAIDTPLQAQLGDSIALLGFDLAQAPLTGGARFNLTLYWQARQPSPTDYTVFVQVLGPTGTVVGQHDGIPWNGSLPTSQWAAGEIVLDNHLLDFAVQEPGDYRLIVGMYNPATGERLPITGPNGAALGDFVPLHTLTVPPPGQ